MTIAKLPTRRRGFIFGTFLVGMLFATGAARAEGGAATFIQAMGDEATATLADGSLDGTERRHQLRALLLGKFDFDAISRFVLGRHWHDTSDEERTEFRRLFSDYVLASYSRQLDAYAGERLKVGRAIDKGTQGTLVESVLSRPGGAAVRVVWRVTPTENGWRVADVMVEGISMALVHRAEVDTMVRNSEIAGLLDRMRQLIGSGDGAKQAAGAS